MNNTKGYMDNFDKYLSYCLDGMSAWEVYEIAKQDGLNFSKCIRMLRKLYNLSLIDAKEVIVTNNQGCESLTEFQEKLAPLIEAELNKNNSQI